MTGSPPIKFAAASNDASLGSTGRIAAISTYCANCPGGSPRTSLTVARD